MLAQEREISQKTLQFGFYERGGGAHIFFPLCESVQLISLWPDVTQREIAPQ